MSATDPQVFFFFLSGSRKGKIEAACAQVVRIGRQPYCELKLDPHQDIPASGDHCHVIREDDGYYLLDSGSTFGTWLNGQRIQGRVKLSTGDVIECGKDVEGGREGPRLKFYLEEDVRKCPICSGPVYKRHFRCPACNEKTCLRCIDFAKKVCKTCAVAAPAKAKSAGFEVVDDDEDVQAKRPAKVVVSGKEAAKLKKKQAQKTAAKKAGAPDLSAPFCTICQDFVKGAAFVCPACAREVCAAHRQGKVCKPCAGVSAEPVAIKKTRLAPTAPPRRSVPDDVEPVVEAEAVEIPSSSWGSKDKAKATPPPPPRPAAPVPRTEDGPPPTIRVRADRALPPPVKKSTHEIKQPMPPPVKTGVASCTKCRGPLGAGTFCCRACRRILCYAHVAVDDCCEDCYLQRRDVARPPAPGRAAPPPPTPAPLPRPGAFFPEPSPGARPEGFRTLELPASNVGSVPPAWDAERGATISEIEALDMMPLLDTEKDEDSSLDDDLARPPPGTSAEDEGGLTGVSFVCPHCDAPLDAAARACARCRKVL